MSPVEHAVIVRYALSGPGYGSEGEREAVYALQRRLRAVIESHGVGDFDGNEFGGGEVVLYSYGPDAGLIFNKTLQVRDAFLTILRRAARRVHNSPR